MVVSGVITRKKLIESVEIAIARRRVVVLVGPRQSGKTTLAREFVDENSVNYFDLEDPRDLQRLAEPMTGLAPLRGLVVIDEIQRRPDLFPVLRVLADRRDQPAKFLVLGSASGELMRQTSESLAGRTERIVASGFTLNEIGKENSRRLWLRGGFPESYLDNTDEGSAVWRREFIKTLLERDLPQWGVRVPAEALHRFWAMLVNYHGQTWKAVDPARALGVDQKTTRHYLDLLTDAFMVRQLQPYHANIAKRQVKAPKIYIRDSGLCHTLLGIETEKELLQHPKVGASWEGWVIEQILATQPHDAAYFWATHQGAEIDLILLRKGKLWGIEIKRADAPKITPSIKNALADLGLERVAIVYPGTKRYPIGARVEVVPVMTLASDEALFP